MNNESIRKFRRGCAMLIGAPNGYDWGKENVNGADCSGLVCHGLFCAGFDIRITADEIYNILGAHVSYKDMILNFDEGMYAIVISSTEPSNPDITGSYGGRRVIHISPFITPYIVIDADSELDRILPVILYDWKDYYKSWRRRFQIIKLDTLALHEYSGILSYGLDHELKLRGLDYADI